LYLFGDYKVPIDAQFWLNFLIKLMKIRCDITLRTQFMPISKQHYSRQFQPKSS